MPSGESSDLRKKKLEKERSKRHPLEAYSSSAVAVLLYSFQIPGGKSDDRTQQSVTSAHLNIPT